MPAKNEAAANGLSGTWNALLKAMVARDERHVAQLTTDRGLGDLLRGVENAADARAERLHQLGSGWQRWPFVIIEDGEQTKKFRLGPVPKEHRIVFVLEDQGWKLDSWNPGK